MTRTRLSLGLVVSVLGVLVTSLARAEPAPPRPPPAPLAESLTGEAKTDYELARLLYQDGDFAGALAKLRSSFERSSDPRLLWNMAACEKNLRHYAAVLELVERYLREGGERLTPLDREEAGALIQTVRAFVVELRLEVNEPGASVAFDGVPKGITPLGQPLRVDMGTHQIRVSKPGFKDFVSNAELAGGRALSLPIVLVPEQRGGTLRVIAAPHAVIRVDGRLVGTSLWDGVLASGAHAVFVSAKGKLPFQTEVLVGEDRVTTLHVRLDDEPPSTTIERNRLPIWVWIGGGALVAGAGLGAYLLLRPEEPRYRSARAGTWGALDL
jgi:hypothetical protein